MKGNPPCPKCGQPAEWHERSPRVWSVLCRVCDAPKTATDSTPGTAIPGTLLTRKPGMAWPPIYRCQCGEEFSCYPSQVENGNKRSCGMCKLRTCSVCHERSIHTAQAGTVKLCVGCYCNMSAILKHATAAEREKVLGALS